MRTVDARTWGPDDLLEFAQKFAELPKEVKLVYLGLTLEMAERREGTDLFRWRLSKDGTELGSGQLRKVSDLEELRGRAIGHSEGVLCLAVTSRLGWPAPEGVDLPHLISEVCSRAGLDVRLVAVEGETITAEWDATAAPRAPTDETAMGGGCRGIRG